MDYFGLILAGLAIVSVIVAAISVRIPPLSTFPDTYMNGSTVSEIKIEKSGNWFTRALNNAVNRANESNLSNFTAKIDNMTFYVFWLTPIIVCWGTLALVFSLYTSLLKIVSLPVEWILMAFGIASPDITASAIMSGLADNYLPVILGQSVESAVNRVIIAMMSIIQIIYLSETATLLISTNKQMKFWHVIVIFLERTFLSLFFVILIAKFFVR
ncbi:nucleoside recognition domain-containing protein [Enterococcus faecalis]|nr:nucleoside recognition domain-containing protein [Enterococcus faecalis]EKD5410585.1 nucleoside recognition domain-containing protein [Enterococcus faecalis]